MDPLIEQEGKVFLDNVKSDLIVGPSQWVSPGDLLLIAPRLSS